MKCNPLLPTDILFHLLTSINVNKEETAKKMGMQSWQLWQKNGNAKLAIMAILTILCFCEKPV